MSTGASNNKSNNSSNHSSHNKTKMHAVEPRSVALRHVLKDPAGNWTAAPEWLRRDKSFVIAVIEKAKELPSKSDFERCFEQWLRFDKDVVLAFCGRPDFEQIYHDRHLFVPGCLTDDKDVMIAYCSKIPRQLQECSERLCDDEEVVLTALQYNGLELQYASIRLKQDEQMVRMACSHDGNALGILLLGNTRHRLLRDGDFLLTVIRNKGAGMFRLVEDPTLKQDRELLLCALQHGLELQYVPYLFQKDPAFVVAAVSRNAAVYLELPSASLQSDCTIARAALVSPTSDAVVVAKAAECAPPILEEDTHVAEAIADRASDAFLRAYLQQHPEYFADRAVMLRAVERDNVLYNRCAPKLRGDVDVVLAAIGEDSAASVLRSVGAEFVRQHPVVAVRAISAAHSIHLDSIESTISDDLWQSHRELQKAWLRRGCAALSSFEAIVCTDRELALLVVQYNHREFCNLGDVLRKDRDFLLEAVQLDGRVLRFAPSAALRGDWELLVRAVAQNHTALDNSVPGNIFPIDKTTLEKHCRELLAAHDVFVGEIVRGIAVGGPGCALAQLDLGCETGTALKQNIGAFLGVPFGTLLSAYQRCHENLVNPPAPPASPLWWLQLQQPPLAPQQPLWRLQLQQPPQAPQQQQRAPRMFDDDNNNND